MRIRGLSAAVFGSLAAGCHSGPIGLAFWNSDLRSKTSANLSYKGAIPSQLQIMYGNPPNDTDPGALRYASILCPELERYGPALTSLLKLQTVVIANDLTLSGETTRGALADPAAHAIYFDYWAANSRGPEQSRHDIHHELFHFACDMKTGSAFMADPVWARLNPLNFRYGQGGAYETNPTASIMNHPKLGFVDKYAESAMEEDMAEIYACSVIPEERKLLDKWRTDDVFLDLKFKLMEKMVGKWGLLPR